MKACLKRTSVLSLTFTLCMRGPYQLEVASKDVVLVVEEGFVFMSGSDAVSALVQVLCAVRKKMAHPAGGICRIEKRLTSNQRRSRSRQMWNVEPMHIISSALPPLVIVEFHAADTLLFALHRQQSSASASLPQHIATVTLKHSLCSMICFAEKQLIILLLVWQSPCWNLKF